MTKPQHKEVSYIITVPKGKYCWDYHTPFALCEHFNNEGGYIRCDLGFHPLKDIKCDGIKKPGVCRNLKEIQR